MILIDYKLMTKSILNYYFNIKYYYIPKGFLIPPIPSRLNYLNLINSLLTEEVNIKYKDITGIDIGTGANIIYPILGNYLYKWKFICSEINEESFNNAKLIIEKNNLENYIKLIKQENKNNIFLNILNQQNKYTFSLCNPPYYDYETEIKLDEISTKYIIKKANSVFFKDISQSQYAIKKMYIYSQY